MIDQQKADEIQVRREAATPGEWTTDNLGVYVRQCENMEKGAMIAELRGWEYLRAMWGLSEDEAIAVQIANAEFIANAPQDISALL